MKKDKKRVAIYIRVSSEEQSKEGISLKAQRRKLEEYSNFKDWYVFKVYEDAGISGKSIKGRKAFSQLLEDAKKEKFSAILVTKFDRAFRNVKEGYMTLDYLSELKIDFISITENIDTTTAMGKAMFGIINVFAQLERELTSERLNFTLNDKFERGIMIGKTPIGYKFNKKTKKIVVDEKETEIVKDIFLMKSEGKGYREICKKYGLKPQSYYNILKNKVYIGIISFEGVEKKGIHPSIISEELFYKINSN